MSAPTVRVRIAVAVAADGGYAASGWSDSSDEMTSAVALDTLDDLGAVHFVEANVPLPKTVEGEVQP